MQFTLPNAHFLLHRSLMRFLCESDDFIVFELETFQFRRDNPSFAKKSALRLKLIIQRIDRGDNRCNETVLTKLCPVK